MVSKKVVRHLLERGAADMAVNFSVGTIVRRDLGLTHRRGSNFTDELSERVRLRILECEAERLALTPRHREALDVLLFGQWSGSWVDLVEVSRLL